MRIASIGEIMDDEPGSYDFHFGEREAVTHSWQCSLKRVAWNARYICLQL